MSTLRARSTPTKQPSIKDKEATPIPTANGGEPAADAPKAAIQRQPSMARNLTSTAANLANLLPTGTLLAFQLLTPMFTNNGACDAATRPMTIVLLVLLALSCFLASFTDSVKVSDGQVYYGLTTFKGLWLFDYPDASGAGLPDLSKFRIRLIDGIHAVLSVLVFGAVALRDRNVLQCLYPQPGREIQEVLNIVPVGVGLICSLLFMVFPTRRHGIGYPVTSVQQWGHSTHHELGEVSLASTTGSSGPIESHSTSSAGSTDFQKDISTSSDIEPDVSSSESTAESFNSAALSGDSRERSKRAIKRPSYLEDYILYK